MQDHLKIFDIRQPFYFQVLKHHSRNQRLLCQGLKLYHYLQDHLLQFLYIMLIFKIVRRALLSRYPDLPVTLPIYEDQTVHTQFASSIHQHPIHYHIK